MCKIYLEEKNIRKLESLVKDFKEETDTVEFVKSQICKLKKQYIQANIILSKVVENNPTVLYLEQAKEIAIYAGDKTRAIKHIKQLIEINPNNGWYYFEYTKLINQESELERFFFNIDTAISLLPKELECKIYRLNFVLTNYELLKETAFHIPRLELVNQINSFQAENPKNKDLQRLLIEVYFLNCNYGELITFIKKNKIYLKVNERFLLAKSLFYTKNYKSAVTQFQLTKDNLEYKFLSNYFLSICYKSISNKRVSSKFEQIAYDSFLEYLGYLESKYKDMVASSNFLKAKSILRQKFVTKKYMSEICLNFFLKSDDQNVKEFFLNKALNICNKNHEALYHKGVTLKDNSILEALSYFLKSVEVEWSFADAHLQLCECYRCIAQNEKASMHQKIAQNIKSYG